MFRKIHTLLMAGVLCTFFSCQENKEDLLKEARTAMQAQDNQKAITVLTKVLALDSNNAEALNMRGVANINIDAFEQAVADFDRAIAIDPNNYKYYYNIANIKRTINQPMGAIADYTKALSLDSSNYELWLTRAQCYASVEKDMEALADLAGAVRHGGAKNADLHLLRGKLLVHTGHPEEAISSLELCLSLQKVPAEAHYWLGEAHLKTNKETACQHFAKSSELGYEEAKHAIEEHCK